MLLSRRLCVLLGAACVGATLHPEVELVHDTSNGYKYWGTPRYFARNDGVQSLCDKLIETYGGIANTCVVIEPIANWLLDAARFMDMLLRGTRNMARDYSGGPNALNNDIVDVLARAEDQSRSSELSVEAQTTLAALMDLEIMEC